MLVGGPRRSALPEATPSTCRASASLLYLTRTRKAEVWDVKAGAAWAAADVYPRVKIKCRATPSARWRGFSVTDATSSPRRRRFDGLNDEITRRTGISTQVYPIAAGPSRRGRGRAAHHGEHGQLPRVLKRPVALRGLAVASPGPRTACAEFRDAHPRAEFDLVGASARVALSLSHSPVCSRRRRASRRPKSSWDAMEMRLLSLLARDVLRAMFVSARVFRATTSSSKSTVSKVPRVRLVRDLELLQRRARRGQRGHRARGRRRYRSRPDFGVRIASTSSSRAPRSSSSRGGPARDADDARLLARRAPARRHAAAQLARRPVSRTKSGEEGLLESGSRRPGPRNFGPRSSTSRATSTTSSTSRSRTSRSSWRGHAQAQGAGGRAKPPAELGARLAVKMR